MTSITGERLNDGVRSIAAAQSALTELLALQQLRQGRGVVSPDDLAELPTTIAQSLLGVDDDPNRNEVALLRLRALVDSAPPRERELLTLAFNFDGASNLDWIRRTESFARTCSWASNPRTVRRKVDLAILQLVMRTREGAEADLVPAEIQDHAAQLIVNPDNVSGRVAAFFSEDYVRSTDAFSAAWGLCQTVDMIGFGHNRMLVSYSSEISSMLARGGRIRVLLQDPEGRAVLEANRRSSTPKASNEAVRHQHRASMSTLRALGSGPNGTVEARTFDFMPPFTAYYFDADESNAVAFIWFWSWRQASSWRPGFRVTRAGDALWFDRFYFQFRTLWDDQEETKLIGIDDE